MVDKVQKLKLMNKNKQQYIRLKMGSGKILTAHSQDCCAQLKIRVKIKEKIK